MHFVRVGAAADASAAGADDCAILNSLKKSSSSMRAREGAHAMTCRASDEFGARHRGWQHREAVGGMVAAVGGMVLSLSSSEALPSLPSMSCEELVASKAHSSTEALGSSELLPSVVCCLLRAKRIPLRWSWSPDAQ